jgi:alanine racemase
MTRPARVVVDLDALRHNLSRVRAFAGGARVMAIVKADAYGHGIERVVPALAGADAFGVACLDEARQVLAAGVNRPVVLLEGPYTAAELNEISESGLEIVVHHEYQLQMLERTPLQRQIRVWLKVDSGMHRLGLAPEAVPDAWQRLLACTAVVSPPRLMTHLAAAGNSGDPLTTAQVETFTSTCRGLDGEQSIANSGGIISCPASHADWVRPGLMLYGVSPMDGGSGADHGLRPVMTLASALISTRNVRRGEPVGYGAAWRCPRDMRIGIVAAGYGDGFPRHAGSGTPLLVGGRRTSVIGVASMDMLTVDLDPVPGADIGDPVVLWGEGLPIEELARHARTIPYELLCGIHKRLRFIENGTVENTVSMQ